jgi:hypothetical protein
MALSPLVVIEEEISSADLRFYDKQTMKVATQALEWAPERKVKHLRYWDYLGMADRPTS